MIDLLERLGGGYICNTRRAKDDIEKEAWISLQSLPDLPPYWGAREDTVTPSIIVCVRSSAFSRPYCEKRYEELHVLIVSGSDAIGCLTSRGLTNAEFIVLTSKTFYRSAENLLQNQTRR
jgi:hypothetical protein